MPTGWGERGERSCATGAGTAARQLVRLQPELKALGSDQRGEKYLEEVLFQNQEVYESEGCPSKGSPSSIQRRIPHKFVPS